MVDKKQVIIIGGGFGGLNAAQALRKADVNILLLDKTNHHLFQPLLYQVATAALSPADIAVPIREVLAKQNNATILLANIVRVDKENKKVIAQNGDSYSYDFLILAPGATHSYFNNTEWEKYAPGLKTLNDALKIREKIILSYERAERSEDPADAQRFMRFVIVGAGPTGVEMAGAIAEIARQTLVRNFRKIKPEQTKIYLIEGAGHVLPSYPDSLTEKAKIALEKLGVEVLLNTRVTKVTSDGVWLGDHFLETPNIIWAAGNEVPEIIRTLNIPVDRAGRAMVNPDLSIPGYPEVFVIGDAAHVLEKNGDLVPGIAPAAMQEGKYVAKIIRYGTKPEDRKPFVYFNKGMMATIGKAKAVAVIGNVKLSGYFAWLTWCFVHIAFLISFSNKLLVMIQWFYLYLVNRRHARLITSPITDKDDPLVHHGE